MSFYPEKLSSFQYYKEKIPLFYRNSYGFKEQFEMLFNEVLKSPGNGLITVGDEILKFFDIFNEDYLIWLEELNPSGTTCDILDKIASIFAVTRHPVCNWIESGVNHNETLDLTNEELLMLIKCEIIRNNFQGTREECNTLYDLIGLNIFSLTVEDYGTVATCKLVLATTPERTYSSNISKMFKSGLLNIKSMGIKYEYDEEIVSTSTMVWDSTDQAEVWNFGGWSS